MEITLSDKRVVTIKFPSYEETNKALCVSFLEFLFEVELEKKSLANNTLKFFDFLVKNDFLKISDGDFSTINVLDIAFITAAIRRSSYAS